MTDPIISKLNIDTKLILELLQLESKRLIQIVNQEIKNENSNVQKDKVITALLKLKSEPDSFMKTKIEESLENLLS